MTDGAGPDTRARPAWLAVGLPVLAGVVAVAGLASAVLRPGEAPVSWENWALPVVMASVLALCGGRMPALGVAVSALVVFAYYASDRPPIGFTLLLIPAIVNAAERGALRAAAAITGAALALSYLIRLALLEQSPSILGVGMLTEFGLLAGALLAGDALRSRRLYRAESEKRRALETAAAEQAAKSRIESERRRIARDIHDAMGHTLVVLGQQSSIAIAKLDTDPDGARSALDVVRRSAKAARSEVDEALRMLLTPGDDPEPSLALEHLDAYLNGLRTDARAVHLAAPVPKVGAALQATAFRVVQEATANSARHSDASRIDVVLAVSDKQPDVLRICVSDNGGARPGWKPGRGLTGMRERVELHGGSMRIDADARSFSVIVELPIRRGA